MEISITHSSTACVLLEIGPLRILTDPVFDTGQAKYRLGPAAKARRYVGPSIDPTTLDPIDAVLLSHDHHEDNLDASGQRFLARVGKVVTGKYSNRIDVADRCDLSPFQTTTIGEENGFQIEVTAMPAQHGPRWLPGARHVVGFALKWEGQQHGQLYISGDTVYYSGLRKIAADYPIGTAILHLGSVHFWPPWPPFLRFTFNGIEAAKFAKLLNPKTIIPIHYERSIWSHFRESVGSYQAEFDRADLSAEVRWLQHGVRTVIDV